MSCSRSILLGLLAAAAAQPQVALQDAFRGCFRIGSSVNVWQFTEKDTVGAAIVKTHFNTITPENVLKWGLVHPEPDRYDFAPADRYVEFGEKYGMFVVGHCLVWHNQTPRWVFENPDGTAVDRETLLRRMHDHIRAVVGRYRGRIRGWDVVNEAVAEDGTLRQSPWMRIIGEDYLARAFHYAHEADPEAELYYNDYALENPARRQGAVELIRKLKQQAVPVTAVGLQNHDRLDQPTAAQLEATIRAFQDLGVKVNITELDVDVLPRAPRTDPYKDGLPDTVQQALARRYAELFGVFVKHRDAIARVTFWCVTDGSSWLNNFPVRGRTNYPLLFDRAGKPKPAFDAVIGTVPKP